jgi:hypothetical protein
MLYWEDVSVRRKSNRVKLRVLLTSVEWRLSLLALSNAVMDAEYGRKVRDGIARDVPDGAVGTDQIS